ncbi:uncharacterized protein LOC141900288 isoform X2 [Tubulanus polymorphus]|uniref:uncharacterized protein LOC141900288 isoform X2 n=1 Tax=Tubulanus polymorphus TaxID=672921 RepID=UPI003DA43179
MVWLSFYMPAFLPSDYKITMKNLLRILSVIHVLLVYSGNVNGLGFEWNPGVAVGETLTMRCYETIGTKSSDLFIFRELDNGQRYYLTNSTRLCRYCVSSRRYISTSDDSNGIAELVLSIERVNGGDSGIYGCSKLSGYKMMKKIMIYGPIESVVWQQHLPQAKNNSLNFVSLNESASVVLDLRNNGSNYRAVRCVATSLSMPPYIDVIIGDREMNSTRYTKKYLNLTQFDGVVSSFTAYSTHPVLPTMINKQADDGKMGKCLATLPREMLKFATVGFTVLYDPERFNITNQYANVGDENVTISLSFYANPINFIQLLHGPNHTPIHNSDNTEIIIEGTGHYRKITVKVRFVLQEHIRQYYLQVNDKYYKPGFKIGSCSEEYAMCSGLNVTVNCWIVLSMIVTVMSLWRL